MVLHFQISLNILQAGLFSFILLNSSPNVSVCGCHSKIFLASEAPWSFLAQNKLFKLRWPKQNESDVRTSFKNNFNLNKWKVGIPWQKRKVYHIITAILLYYQNIIQNEYEYPTCLGREPHYQHFSLVLLNNVVNVVWIRN